MSRRIGVCFIYLGLGLLLTVLSMMEYLDEFYAGMGAALIMIGAMRLYQYIRYAKDENYRENKTIQLHDERNAFIRNKAWAWTGYILVLIGAISTIVFKLIGKEELMMFSSFVVCLILILYYIMYYYLQKKY